MDKQSLLELFKTIKTAFPQFVASAETADLWFRLLSGHDAAILAEATDNFIKQSTYPPTIADINLGAVAIEEEEAKIKRDVMNNWRSTASLQCLDDNVTKLYERAVFSQPREKWRECGRYLEREVAAHDRELAEDVIRRVAGL